MITMIIFIAIIAMTILFFFNNKVKNRNIDRANKLAEKQEELIQSLKDKETKNDAD